MKNMHVKKFKKQQKASCDSLRVVWKAKMKNSYVSSGSRLKKNLSLKNLRIKEFNLSLPNICEGCSITL